MDKYPIEAAGSNIENNPMYRVFLKRPVDPVRLEAALNSAMKCSPLFKTRVEFDKEYYLRDNDRPLVILEVKEEERPPFFGKNTNDYPWRICYDGNKICFEWLHGVSDGAGALTFLKQILLAYFEVPQEEKSMNYLVAPGLEPFFDEKEKGDGFAIDPDGFSAKDFPKKYGGYETDCHLLRTDTQKLVELAHLCKSSVTPVIAILFSRALRKHLPKKAKNRNVACNIVLDLRRSLHYETMHNCVEYKRITYVDDFDSMNFASVAAIYREKLDRARKVPNVVRAITERVKTFQLYHIFASKRFLKFAVSMVGLILKDRDCNFVVTYPGKISLPEAVTVQVENLDLKIWHDFGECIISAIDYNGSFNLNIQENYAEKGVVEDFIALSREVGIEWEDLGTSVFRQSHFEES